MKNRSPRTTLRVPGGGWLCSRRGHRATTSAPLAGRVVPEVDEPDVREVFFRTYRIVYRVMEGEVHVLTVFEGSRPLLVETMSDETGSRE